MKKKLAVLGIAALVALPSGCSLMVDTVEKTAEFSYALNGLQKFHSEAKTHVESVSGDLSPEALERVEQAMTHLEGLKVQLEELEKSGDWQSLLDNPQAVRLEYTKAARSFTTLSNLVAQRWTELTPDQREILVAYEVNARKLYEVAGVLLDKGEAAESLRKIVKIAQLAAKTAKYL